MTPNRVTEFAKSKGFTGAEYLKKWNGYECYEPTMGDSDYFTGLPIVIMVKGEEIRMSTPKEAMQI